MRKEIIFGFVAILGFGLTVSGQIVTPPGTENRNMSSAEVQRQNAARTEVTSPRSNPRQSPGTRDPFGNYGTINGQGIRPIPPRNSPTLQRQREIDKSLKPAEAYFEKYRDFLKGENTGLAKMYPVENTQRPVKIADDYHILIPIEGAYYDFEKETHSTINYEIKFSEGKIYVVNEKTLVGKIDLVGDVALEDLTPLSAKVRDFYNMNSAKELFGGRLKSDVALQNNMTYVLRTGWEGKILQEKESIFHTKKVEKEVSFLNSVIVFRIAGRDADGGYLVLWKKIK